ncbi:MAG: ParB/RepB/Spo0J family partition protein [Desulfovibrionaceae bacterium]
MAANDRGLGRGLDALLKGYQSSNDAPEIHELSIASIVPNPYQPRREFAPDALDELALSIKQQGVLQPVLVRAVAGPNGQNYELVAGERRLRASQLAGMSTIPAMVRELSNEESLAIALIENLQREDLNPIEEALGLQQLKDQFGLNQEDLAKRISKSRPAVANLLRLLNLPQAIQDDIRLGNLSSGHARALLAIDEAIVQTALRNRIVEHGLTVRDAEAQVAFWREHKELPPAAAAPLPATSRKRVAKEESSQASDLDVLADKLTDALQVKVAARGSMSRGHLILSFRSHKELEAVLGAIGIDPTSFFANQP